MGVICSIALHCEHQIIISEIAGTIPTVCDATYLHIGPLFMPCVYANIKFDATYTHHAIRNSNYTTVRENINAPIEAYAKVISPSDSPSTAVFFLVGCAVSHIHSGSLLGK